MSDTYTTNYGLVKIESGTSGWTDKANGNMDTIDTQIKTISTAIGSGVPYVNVKDFGAFGNGSNDDTASVQLAIDSLSVNGGTVYFPNGTYKLTSGGANSLVINKPNVALECSGGTTLNWTTLGGYSGIRINSDNFSIDNFILIGPTSASYVSSEVAIEMIGTSHTDRLTGPKIKNCEFYNFGYSAIRGQFFDFFDIANNYIHNIGYSAVQLLSCRFGNIRGNRIKTITPGSSSNMYCIQLTHNATGYNTDPNRETDPKNVANPFCQGINVTDNFIEDSAWLGIDAHGGYELNISGNTIYGCYSSISIGGSSGDAALYSGYNNIVSNNIMDSRNADFSASGRENLANAIGMRGGEAAHPHRHIKIHGNYMYGYGKTSEASAPIGAGGVIYAQWTKGAVISNNTFESWGGVGVLINESVDMTLNGNTFKQLASAGDTVARCIHNSSSGAEKINLVGNTIDSNGGTTALYGYYAPSHIGRLTSIGNDFSLARTADVSTGAAGKTINGFTPSSMDVSAAPAGDVDLSSVRGTGICTLYFSNTGPITVSNFTNAEAYKIIICYFSTTNVVTIDRTNAFLSGGVSFTSTQFDTITLMNNGGLWVELNRSVNS